MSDSLWPHGLQHARLSCPSLSPRASLNSCVLSRWCHPTISPSVVSFSSCLQSFPASGTFPMNQLFTSGGESVWVWINIYCTLAALSLRNRRLLMNLLHKIWMYFPICISSVQLLSHVWLCDPMNCSTPGLPVHHQLPEFTQTHVHPLTSVMPSNHLIPSAACFSFCLQSFLASGSFPMNQLFTSGGQSIGASASALPVNIQGWFPLGLTGLISLQSKGLSRVFSSTRIWSHQFFSAQGNTTDH